jgi:hypothetical protein
VDERQQPAAGSEVLILPHRIRATSVTTNDQGEFLVRGLKPSTVIVHAESPKRDAESEWLEARVEEERDTPELLLVLRSRVLVQGRVFAANGPVPGARVQVFSAIAESGGGSSDSSISGPAGEFTVKLPHGSQIAHVSVLAPGHATRMFLAQLGKEPVLEIPLERVGGKLVFDLGKHTLDEIRSAGAGLLAHGGSFVPLGSAMLWARLKRADQHDPHLLVLPDMEAGEYALCMGPEAQVAVPRGHEPPVAQCSRGSLLPLQELRLMLHEVPEQYLGQSGPSPKRGALRRRPPHFAEP